jgi:hypothetical protein
MSNYQPKEGSGALFKNDKGDNPARPDYRGDIMLGGVLYEVSGWIKPLPSDPEKRFMSLSGKPKEQRQQQGRPPAPPTRQAPPPRRQSGNSYDERDDRDGPPF